MKVAGYFVFTKKMSKGQGIWVHWLKKGHRYLGYAIYVGCKLHIVFAFFTRDRKEHYSKLTLLFVVVLTNISVRLVLEIFLARFVRSDIIQAIGS